MDTIKLLCVVQTFSPFYVKTPVNGTDGGCLQEMFRVGQGSPVFPRAKNFSIWPNAKKPLLAVFLEPNSRLSLSLKIFIQKLQITAFYVQVYC
jgi:hypothetical protein